MADTSSPPKLCTRCGDLAGNQQGVLIHGPLCDPCSPLEFSCRKKIGYGFLFFLGLGFYINDVNSTTLGFILVTLWIVSSGFYFNRSLRKSP
jgi:hypothetical protein